MSKKKLKLTKTAVAGLAAMASNYVAGDTEQPGFGVRVRANTGTKAFIAMYRVAAKHFLPEYGFEGSSVKERNNRIKYIAKRLSKKISN